MFLIRQATSNDLGIMLKLAKMVHFINLPPDRDVIADRIRNSRRSFEAANRGGEPDPAQNGSAHRGEKSAAGRSDLFMFVLEDTETGNAIGTSTIIAEMGTPGNPNVSFQLMRREFFSSDLQVGATHVTARLILDENGPTEIGGLILAPSYRGHKARLGMQLSLVRFHYIALHRDRFKDRLLAEMMAPLTADGGNTLWEYLGRRFINLSYSEADRFCAHSREFMTALLPREELYLTFLPPEARALIGQVGRETVPARRMLERLGFAYHDRIDPFDGGPHLEAATEDVSIIKDTYRAPLEGSCSAKEAKRSGLVSYEEGAEGEFRAVFTNYADAGDGVKLPAKVMKLIGAEPGASIGVTPLDVDQRNVPGASRTAGVERRAASPRAKATTRGKRSSRAGDSGGGSRKGKRRTRK